MFVKEVQDTEEALEPNTVGSEGGKVSRDRRLIELLHEEISFPNKERKRLNKKVSSWESNNYLSWEGKILLIEIEPILCKEQELIAILADRQSREITN